MLKAFCCICLWIFIAIPLKAQILVKREKSPAELVNLLMGANAQGIRISNVKYIGSKFSIGEYHTFSNHMPIKSGIVLSTGKVSDVDGPNEEPNMGSAMFSLGDEQLQQLCQSTTSDAAILEFVFIANTDEISFQYSFASEEYPEYVNKGVNDVFAFLISGKGYKDASNIALVPNSNDYVSVDNVNSNVNAEFYIENYKWDISNPVFDQNPKIGEISYNCEFDGMTVPLLAKAKIIPYQPYKLRIAIADVGDNVYDSGVFIKKRSLKSSGSELPFQTLLVDEVKTVIDSINILEAKAVNDTVRIISNIQFAFNSHLIEDDDFKFLDSLSILFDHYFSMNVRIEGHSDDVGDKEYNMQLSQERAKQVYNYLKLQGIAESRLSFVGKGDNFPLLSESSEESRKLNRRVEFIVYQP